MQNLEIKVKPYELKVNGYIDEKEGWIGTLLTLANGYIGVRGVLDVLSRRDKAVFMMGLYSDVPIWRREIVVLPSINSAYLVNPSNFNISSVERKLDMRNGVLTTTMNLNTIDKTLVYSSESIVHRVYKNLYAQRVRIDSGGEEVSIVLPIESNLNPFLYGYTYTEHLIRTSLNIESNEINAIYKLRNSNNIIKIQMIVKPKTNCIITPFATREAVGFTLVGRNIDVERYVFIDRDEKNRLDPYKILQLDWNSIIEQHSNVWERLWSKIGLEVEGDEFLAGGITFYTYHLLQLIDEDADELMIPARGLHGIGYRGHVFWDTDIYLLPFLVFLLPEAARKVLKFRCRTLKAAIEYAIKTGYKGARYPWEADDQGVESTPRYYPVDISECKCIDILTGELEQHITGDIAFAVDLYYTVTGDREFLKQCGLKILVEIARFWASRVEYDSLKNHYVIKSVIGPDEYHVGVDNNFYTNYLAKYALKTAVKYVYESLEDPELKHVLEDCGVSIDEVKKWSEIGDLLYTGRVVNNVIEQFEGYFDLVDPSIPGEIVNRVDLMKLGEISKTKLIKQADVVLALVLKELIEGVNFEVLRKNYEYYSKYTTHESSLSLPIYTTLAFIVRDEKAIEYLNAVLKTDLGNLYNNTHDGFHVATAGGLWYAILLGIMGLRIRNGELVVNSIKQPGLSIAVNIHYKGSTIRASS